MLLVTHDFQCDVCGESQKFAVYLQHPSDRVIPPHNPPHPWNYIHSVGYVCSDTCLKIGKERHNGEEEELDCGSH